MDQGALLAALGETYECIGCYDDKVTAEEPPLFDGDGNPYCVECLGKRFEPIANDDENVGAPRLDELVLAEVPGFLDRIDQDIRRRYEAIIVCRFAESIATSADFSSGPEPGGPAVESGLLREPRRQLQQKLHWRTSGYICRQQPSVGNVYELFGVYLQRLR